MKLTPKLSITLLLILLIPTILSAQSIFLTKDEILSLPTTGGGWNAVKAAADQSPGTPNLGNQDSPENCRTLARALVYLRTGDSRYRDKVVTALRQVPGTESGGRTLALGRQLGAYVIAADLIGYRDPAFVDFVKNVRNETLDGSTLIKKHEEKANNWSQVIGWSRVIADLYIPDATDLARAVKVVKGTLGDRSSFTFPADAFGEMIWQSDPTKPVVVLPSTATIQGHVMSGALPEELRRASLSFRWPPPCENYCWSANEGLLGTLWVLWHSKTMPDAFDFMDKGELRVMQWLHQQANCPATGNDTHQPHVVNAVYGTTFPAASPSQHGKLFGFGDWWARVAKPAPPPTAQDFQATWEFHFLPDTNSWSVHKLDSEATGAGSTPAAALADWAAKYGTEIAK